VVAVLSLGIGTALGAWVLGRDRQQRALFEAETLRHAIATGQQRDIELRLRRQLALVAAGEAVSAERQWLARAQLGGLLVAEWRLDEAREIYGADDAGLSPQLQALANFGRHELAVLTGSPDEERLAQIRTDRDRCMDQVPPRYRPIVADAWLALEGLCLVRMGRAREAAPALEKGLPSLAYNPARVVYLFHLGQAYEHVGERRLAGENYRSAEQAFPGTRLASEARARALSLGAGAADGLFRGMLPEAPGASSTALVPVPDRDDSGKRE
jgi:tetratricopeptide (TPR) repeat protein